MFLANRFSRLEGTWFGQENGLGDANTNHGTVEDCSTECLDMANCIGFAVLRSKYDTKDVVEKFKVSGDSNKTFRCLLFTSGTKEQRTLTEGESMYMVFEILETDAATQFGCNI